MRQSAGLFLQFFCLYCPSLGGICFQYPYLRPTAALFLSDRRMRYVEATTARAHNSMEPKLPRCLLPLRRMPTNWQLSAVSHGPLWLCCSESRLHTGNVESRQKFYCKSSLLVDQFGVLGGGGLAGKCIRRNSQIVLNPLDVFIGIQTRGRLELS